MCAQDNIRSVYVRGRVYVCIFDANAIIFLFYDTSFLLHVLDCVVVHSTKEDIYSYLQSVAVTYENKDAT